MKTRRSVVHLCAIASAIGLSCNLLWCTLMGHTPGFMLSSLSLGETVNARTFWLFGILVMSVLLVALPGQIERRERSLAYVMPVLSAVGTACFALSFHQDLFDPTALATTGIAVAGLGYFWFVSRFVMLLSRAEGFAVVVWCIVAAFPLRQLASLVLDGFIDPAQQVMVAIALPFLSALFLQISCGAARRRGESSMAAAEDAQVLVAEERPGAAVTPRQRQGANDLVIVLVIVGVLLAMVRVFGPSGVWGDSNTTYFDSLGRIPAITLLTILLATFAALALLAVRKQPVSLRFQLPILIVIGGLFVVVVRTQLGDSPSALLDSIVQANDPFAHLLFWSAIAAALCSLDMAANRIVGIPGLVYAALSIVWVVFLRGSAVVETAVILVVVALVMNRSWLAAIAGARKEAPVEGGHGGSGQAVDADASDATSQLARSIAARCEEVARDYALSPRESEVFMLLAQGRTCSFVQDELVLAESTVKTHMSHIYAKLDVSGRQEMMDLLFGEVRDREG